MALGDWNLNSDYTNALLLLHEMGHVLENMGWTGGVFQNNDSNPFVNQMNDNFLKTDCGKDLN